MVTFFVPPLPVLHGCVLPWTAGCREAEQSREQHLPLAAAARRLSSAGLVLPRLPGPPVLGVKSALNPFQQVEGRFFPSSGQTALYRGAE